MRDQIPGIPRGRVDAWLREALPNLVGDQPWSVDLISGGLSNITYRLHLANAETILRRPPLGGVLPSAHDMTREFKILTALAPNAVPVPEPLALCSDSHVLGYPLCVMRAVDGAVPRTAEDTRALTVPQRATVADALAQTLSDPHSVDLHAAGVADFGRHGGYAQRQIKRWARQWESSKTRDLPDMDRLLALLADRIPPQVETTIVHGDYRLDNIIVDLEQQPMQVAAVVDWELSTLGDPLADLALAMVYWHDRGDTEREIVPVALGVTAHEGFPTAAEFADRYAELTGRNLSQLPFHLALAAMKLAVILEGVHTRHEAGHTVSGGYADMNEAVPTLVTRGLRCLAAD